MAQLPIIEDGDNKVPGMVELSLDPEGNITDAQLRELSDRLRVITAKLNTGISHGRGGHGERAGNHDEQYYIVTTPDPADKQFEVVHGLGRVPIGVEIALKTAACDVYASNNASWTDSVIYLKASAALVQLRLRIY